MKRSKKILVAMTALITFCLVLVLAACSSGASASGDAPSSDGDSYAVGSMMAVHQEGVIDPDKEYTKKDCLSCHPRDTIDAATANYGGEANVNPHAAHTEAYDCLVCHSMEGTSSLKCNGCHEHLLPEGWESPPKESGSQAR